MDIESEVVKFASLDLQKWMASVGKDTTEAAVASWQQGYIAGIQRAISIRETLEVEEL
jgi:hypothetical protein